MGGDWKSSLHVRAHSTGNIRNPEDVWLQAEETIQPQLPVQQTTNDHKLNISNRGKAGAPLEVLVPINWTHEHGLRLEPSNTCRLPFQTVQLERAYHSSNN